MMVIVRVKRMRLRVQREIVRVNLRRARVRRVRARRAKARRARARRRAVAAALIAFANDALGSGRVRFSHLLQAIQPPAHLLQVTVHDGALLRGVGVDIEASVHTVAGAPVLQALLPAEGAGRGKRRPRRPVRVWADCAATPGSYALQENRVRISARGPGLHGHT